MQLHERITVEGLDEAENDTANMLLEQLNNKLRRNLLRASYYDGRRAIRQVGTIIPPHYYHLGIVLGWSAKAVDILARRCNLDGFVWPDGDIDAVGLRDVWDDNNFSAEASSALISSLIHGVSFLVNTAGDEQAGEVGSLIHVKDAMNATGEWNPRRRHLDNLLSVIRRGCEGSDNGKPVEFILYLDGETVSVVLDGKWQVIDRTTHSWGVPVEALIRKPIKELVDELDPRQFWQIHRSTLVNTRAIAAVTRDERGRQLVGLRGSPEKLEVSRSYSHLFKSM